MPSQPNPNCSYTPDDHEDAMITETWHDTFSKLETFTHELEKEKSFVALYELKPLWRIMLSVQLRYIPVLDPALTNRLKQIAERLEIRDVAPSAYPVEVACTLLGNLGYSCSIDPDSFDEEDR
ncbi:hypothetical protein D3C76_112790 [compost metagenome]